MKNTVDDLAILGGQAAFPEPLHVGRPNIGDRTVLLGRINDLLDRRWLTNNGPLVREFEQRIAKLLEVKHCIAVCNATVALEIAVRATGLCGEVIVPSFTFIATAHALQWQGITPVFCEVKPATHNLDPARVESMITSRTTGIIGVHAWGRPCAIEALTEIAARRRLRLLFDAAHAFGNSHKGRMIGNFGDAEVFSFHATKFLNTFEGGAVATNDDELADRVRVMKNFGFAGSDSATCVGTNGKMSEIAAAMGLTGLESLEEFIEVNHQNYLAYLAHLRDLPGISIMPYDETERNNYQYVIVEVDAAVAGMSRDELVAVLHSENVLARRYFYPGCHRTGAYRALTRTAGLSLPETEALAERVMSLPSGTSVNEGIVERICQIIRLALDNSSQIRQRM